MYRFEASLNATTSRAYFEALDATALAYWYERSFILGI